MIYRVYKITNLINGKCYIGLTKQPNDIRFGQHISDATRRAKVPLHHAIMKYGKENFIFEILEDCLSKRQAAEKEKELIFLFKSLSKQNGYNVSAGGESGRLGTDSWNVGLTKETSDIMARISERQKGNNNSFYGKTHSIKQKEKWKNTRVGENHPSFGSKRADTSLRNSKPIMCLENGIAYPSLKAAAISLGIKRRSSVSDVLLGNKKSACGYSFIYVDKEK